MATRSRGLAVSIWFLITPATALAGATTGVSDERVVLPDGPGSIGGIGENVEVDPNMALMRLPVPIEVPEGFPGLTPDLTLQYSSGGGNGEVGLGWSLPVPSIERMSARGLPEYVLDDEFAADGGDELVFVETAGTERIYRTRFEGSFVRYKWHDAADGPAGYFTAEYPSGEIGYFGADRNGTPVPEARVTTPDGGVFRYHLVDLVDRFGHYTSYSYIKHGNYPLLDEIGYVHTTDETPRFSVRFAYEARPDRISDCVPGFDLVLGDRLSEVRIFSEGEQIRRYDLSYEDASDSGGASRLQRVTQLGRNDIPHPIEFSFGYSKALGGTCDTDCDKPFVVDMGTLPNGITVAAGNATLLDINGDSLPDMLSTGTDGAHQFVLSELSTEGRPTFGAVVDSSATSGGSSFILSAPGVQVFDVNGDGFSDIADTKNNAVLCNDGSGDWAGNGCLGDASLGSFTLSEDDAGEADPLYVRFFDYDNDKRIDLIHTPDTLTTLVYANDGTGFSPVTVDAIGSQFDASQLEFADMNGDGLLDPTEPLPGGQIRYRLNLGFGAWEDWVTIDFPGLGGLDSAALSNLDVEDINGDGLDDVVVVLGNELQYALNRNGDQFDPVVTVTSANVDGDLPARDSNLTTVLYADMNGNGTRDVVWITGSAVRFLELFPVKPNLLSRVENGIGMVQVITYGTSIAERARDEGTADQWRNKLPHAMTVVKRTDTWTTLTGAEGGTGLHEVVELDYRHGYYDGVDKQFRGYEYVAEHQRGDMQDSQAPGLTVLEYDVGAKDAYFNGKLLRESIFAVDDGGGTVPLRETRTEYTDCPVADVPDSGLDLPVRFVCAVAERTTLQEGAPEAQWLTLRSEQEYDGYGNVTLESNFGVAHAGSVDSPSGCLPCERPDGFFGAPCGSDCRGDESFTETEYISPGAATGGEWIVGQPSRQVTYGVAGGAQRETAYYYDGPAFEGLDAGTLERGLVTRVSEWVDEGGDLIDITRNAFDEHGNVIETLDPLGSASGAEHRRQFAYDSEGLNVVRTEIFVGDDAGSYALRRDVTYEGAFNQPSESTSWMVVEGDSVVSARNSTSFRYDAHGRLVRLIRPGDTDEAPTFEYSYLLGDPSSKILVHSRSRAGGPVDLEEIRCQDGRGRTYQTRTRIADGSYQVTGFSTLNSRGASVRIYQPYVGTSSECDTAPPDDVPSTSYRYDPLFREIEATESDEGLYGSGSKRVTEYEPLAAIRFDEEDSDRGSSATDTPVVQRSDGLGRLVAVDRYLESRSSGGSPESVIVEYDSLGRLAAYTDPIGNRRMQEFDLLDRVTRVNDPNFGEVTYEYDAASNLVGKTDARGVTVRWDYDGNNRRVAEYDAADAEATRVTFKYDRIANCDRCTNPEGKLVEVRYPLGPAATSSHGFDRFGYDGRDQEVYALRNLEGTAFETSYRYDNVGRLVGTTHPDGQTVDRVYDDGSRLVAIDGVLEDIVYDQRGNLTELRYANGVTGKLTFDVRRRLESLQTIGARVLQGYEYERDRADNIHTVTDLAEGSGDRPDATATYDYDAWYRVLEASLSSGAGAEETLEYTYDTADNILEAVSSLGSESPANVGAYKYSASRPNAVTKAGSISYGYDAAGRVTSRGSAEYARDFLGRLTEVTRSSEVEGQFAYGAGSDRVMKMEDGGVVYYVSPSFVVRDGIASVYPRLDRDRMARLQSDALATTVLSDRDADGRIGVGDAWLAQEDDAGERAVGRLLRASARRVLYEAGDGVTYLHHDDLGNVTLATDGTGEVVGERLFYPTGEVRYESGFVDEYGFTGQEHDESTGLVHFAARDLDVRAGRWASTDPLFEVVNASSIGDVGESTTAYAYVANNFVNAADEAGLAAGKTSGKHAKKLGRASYAFDLIKNSTSLLGIAGLSYFDGDDGAVKATKDAATFIGIGLTAVSTAIGVAQKALARKAKKRERAVNAVNEAKRDKQIQNLQKDVESIKSAQTEDRKKTKRTVKSEGKKAVKKEVKKFKKDVRKAKRKLRRKRKKK